MRKIWSFINNMKIESGDKNNLFLFVFSIICGICGALVWLAIGRVVLPGYTWLFCFAGYSVVFGFLGSYFYLCTHEFS